MGATDSKLAFRKGVFRLFEERNIPNTADDYWTLFWTLPETVDDVYTLVGSTDIRKARDTAIENLETLIDKLIEQMGSILHSTTPVQNIYLLNCCRVLTRILPYIFESPELAEWEEKFFWTEHKTASRGQVLLSLTLQSLFLAGFTLPQSMGTVESRVNYVIWETGIGSSTPIGSSRDNDMNRTEVLRLLTVLLSKSMYMPPSQILAKEDRWLNYMVSKTERKVVLAFLCSMINTSCKFNPMGWTAVPYNHIMFSDPREHLVALCLRCLLIVLDYYSPFVRQTEEVQEEGSSKHVEPVEKNEKPTIDVSDNAFRYYLSKLHRAQDFQFLIDGIYRILSSPMQTLNSYLPGSSKRVRYHVEMMMLCWKLLEVNNRFRNYLIETERALDLMIVLLYYATENKLDPSQVGLVRMCSFILQTLSSDRTFSVKLNKPFDGHASLPVNIRIPNFQGSYADYLILTIFSLIASSRGALSTLYPALTKTVTNISPYLKNLSQTTSSKLLALFSSMSAPGFLLADESNHHLIEYLLEALNNLLQFQFSNNPGLVYAILRSHRKFQRLAEFSLDNALIEIERARQAKESRLPRQSSEEPGGATSPGMSEKAKGKLPEVSLSRSSTGSSAQSLQATPQRQPSVSSIGSAANLLPGAKNGFIPTDDWIYQWHSRLPLDTTTALIHDLLPQLESKNLSYEQIIEYLRNLSITDILPVAHPVIIRKFQWSDPLVIWFRSMLWGQAYIASISNYGPWNNTHVKLFHVKQQQQQQQQQQQSQQVTDDTSFTTRISNA
ncbi:high-temperature-induced dauer-formation protein-domain-containing protein [Gilbertella persicaria]|uniref:high-temperature-induced dauer-formation protein-domain-containing protein n=1 Tax=Gilbertella persicaria TaxID=101096 RepID=UPI00221FF6B9|nr:high-temperature-induced dauer-formation protein-domain-containing protein [Gilbertella persicaria]KAI8062826.1 high-temperature-induced dauer-formation protein-domain-containing protein [Gilbertella persicaria]